MSKKELTQERLKELLDYDNITGIFTWKTRTANKIQIGDIAGTLTPIGYITISIENKRYLAHVLAWFYNYGVRPVEFIDHKNNIKYNNWINNLREATKSDNELNTPLRKNNTSGQRGVYYFKRDSKWEVKFILKGINYYLGRFDIKEEAIKIAKDFINNNHGEFKYG